MRSERLYLEDMLRATGSIRSYLAGVSEDDWVEDEQLRSAVTFQLVVIGEAAARVSSALKARHPEIPWPDVVGFRNLAVHAYFAINPEIVWHTARADAPALAVAIGRILEREFFE